jgi:hypothetical protein
MRSVLDSPAHRHKGRDFDPQTLPAARTFRLRSHRASLALRALRATVLLAAQATLYVGEAGPEAVLAELWRAVGDLAAWWREAAGDRAKAMAKGRIS